MKNTGLWIFLGICGGAAALSGTLPALIAGLFGIVATYAVLKLVCRFLAHWDPRLNLPVISFKTPTVQSSTWDLSPDIQEAVTEVGRRFSQPDDTLLLLNNRFAHQINAPQIALHDPTIISKRLLFEYYRRYGNLETRYIRRRLTYHDVIAPLSDSESREFEAFLRRF